MSIFEKSRLVAAAPLFLLAQLGMAGAQQPKSQAENWGLQNEQATVLAGKVVDVACELTKDCPAQCGAGRRQLGLLMAGGRLVLIVKNGQPLFNGAVADLLPYCNKSVEVDGLMAGNETTRVFQLQLIREQGAADWAKTERWTKEWQERNPSLADKWEEWFYHDPRVTKEIDARGHLGLGAAADREFAKTR
jgi:hypothetical protein